MSPLPIIAKLGGPLAAVLAASLTTVIVYVPNSPRSASANTTATAVTTAEQEKHGERFLRKSVEGSEAEIKLGNLAKQKSKTTTVRDFGNRMVQDHTAALTKIRSFATQKNID